MKIMIVEDDELLAEEISSFLTRWGYETALAERFDNIEEEFLECGPGLILMDINLPFYDGFYWCGRIRRHSFVPVIFISSRSDDRDKIMSLAQGGDDFVEKPFQLELLKAKIEAILRRTYQYRVRERINLGFGVLFDGVSKTAFCDGEEISLTKTERQVLAKFAEERPDVVTRDTLMMDLWDTDEYVSDGTLTTVICRLRNKLKSACGEELILTKKGQGYYIP